MGELVDGQPIFPGEDELDQLYLIQKLLGPLIPDQKEMFLKNPRFLGMKFPEIFNPETLERRYLGKVSKKAMSFMKQLLKMDPHERLTCEEALQHSYFDGMNERKNVDNRQTVKTQERNSSIPDRFIDENEKVII